MRVPMLATLLGAVVVCGMLLFAGPSQTQPREMSGALRAFTAQTKIEVAEDGKNFRTVSNGTFYRDSNGRVRTDATFTSKDGRASRRVNITVPDGGSVVRYSLDPDRLTGTRHSSPLPKVTDPTSPTKWRVSHFQELGTRRVEGMDCRGLRYGPAPVATHYDVWRCEPGHVNVERTYYKANGSIERETLFGLRFEEPSPSLFDTAGYKIEDHGVAGSHPTGTCPVVQQNPLPRQVTQLLLLPPGFAEAGGSNTAASRAP